MMLRLMLVSLVASMGLELPSGRDVSCWGESASAWVNSVLCDTKVASVEVPKTTSPDLACLPVETDLAFQVASGELVREYAHDRSGTCGNLPTDDAVCDVAPAGPVEVIAIGLPDGEELASLAPVADAIDGEALATIDQFDETNEDDASTSADRLASAVRLTCEAAQAWAAVIQEPADAAGCSR